MHAMDAARTLIFDDLSSRLVKEKTQLRQDVANRYDGKEELQ